MGRQRPISASGSSRWPDLVADSVTHLRVPPSPNVKFRGAADSRHRNWPTSGIGARRHSPAKSERRQTVWWTKPLATRTSSSVKRAVWLLAVPPWLAAVRYWVWSSHSFGAVRPEKVRCDREQTAHLQTALLRVVARAQIRTAQPGSIRGTGLGAIAAPHGLPSSPAAGLTCQTHLREHVLAGRN